MFGTSFWLIMITGFAFFMFIIVPPHRIIELLTFGIVFGFLLGNIILYTGTTLLPLFNVNDNLLPFYNWGLSIPIAWLMTVIVFAYYLPKIVDTRAGLYLYILFWAGGTTFMYLVLKYLGYWQDVNWNPLFNTILATSTHTIMAFYLYRTKYITKYRKTHKPKNSLFDELRERN
ncbi:MAG: hypothetical protein JM58_13320 [Peptococcaceae bacterium BICA1-8]|nr:MAG: hypothetical protein JM58_13320 [Peptococcaceae bacterium BICA1-8]